MEDMRRNCGCEGTCGFRNTVLEKKGRSRLYVATSRLG
jgi:hypothetical protein